MQKGDEQLSQGLIAPARLLYERAADLGLAQGCYGTRSHIRPFGIVEPHLRGISPDAKEVKEAKRWYERARQLGAGDADQRLQRRARVVRRKATTAATTARLFDRRGLSWNAFPQREWNALT